jgi:hypothetical protein
MFETIQTYLPATRPRHSILVKHVATIAFFLCGYLSLPSIAWPEQCGQEKYDGGLFDIAFALAKPPIIEPEAFQLAENFIDNTLPRLLGEDPILARQLGFSSAQDLISFHRSGVVLEPPLPLFVINLKDLRDFVKRQTLPLKLIAGEVNWTRVSEEDLGPARLLFPIRLSVDATESGIGSKSSVLVEKLPLSRWRIHNAGGPALIRAVKLYSSHKEDFLVSIPGINRHYLGRIGPDLRVKMTVLFDDPVARVNAGHEFDPCDSEVLDKLKQLDRLLQPQMENAASETNPAPARRNRIPRVAE